MTQVLVTGMSGTGKSTALAESARRGHRVVDADLPAWSTDVTSPAGSDAEQLWREDAMDALLAQHLTGWLFVAGCASNQGSFYDRFDAVVLLSVPREVLLLATCSASAVGADLQPLACLRSRPRGSGSAAARCVNSRWQQRRRA